MTTFKIKTITETLIDASSPQEAFDKFDDMNKHQLPHYLKLTDEWIHYGE